MKNNFDCLITVAKNVNDLNKFFSSLDVFKKFVALVNYDTKILEIGTCSKLDHLKWHLYGIKN